MNKQNWKEFIKRGMMFGGFGPVIIAVIYLIAAKGHELHALDYFTATISGYILAFFVAGCSVFYQIESWGPAKASLLHILCLYFAYLGCYLLNGWIEASWAIIGIFTGIFLVGYLIIWTIVAVSVKATARRLNAKITEV